MRILIVERAGQTVRYLEEILAEEGFRVRAVPGEQTALAVLEEQGADLALVTAGPPGSRSFDVVRRIKGSRDIPVIVMMGSRETDDVNGALASGADEMLFDPFVKEELLLKLNNLLRLKEYENAVRQFSADRTQYLRDLLRRRERITRDMVFRVVGAVESKLDETLNHAVRLAKYSRAIATYLGYRGEFLELIESAAPLHDIGKIGIPDRILFTPDRLTPREEELMRSHTVIGASILEGDGDSLRNLSRDVALYHHEHWDGSGYPEKRRGAAIPVAARIVALADVFDALTSPRNGRTRCLPDRAALIINDGRGRLFDPLTVDAFLKRFHEICMILRQYPDPEPRRPEASILDCIR